MPAGNQHPTGNPFRGFRARCPGLRRIVPGALARRGAVRDAPGPDAAAEGQDVSAPPRLIGAMSRTGERKDWPTGGGVVADGDETGCPHMRRLDEMMAFRPFLSLPGLEAWGHDPTWCKPSAALNANRHWIEADSYNAGEEKVDPTPDP